MTDGDAAPDPPGAASPRDEDGCPPAFGSWRTLYALVVLELAALVALFTLFARHFG